MLGQGLQGSSKHPNLMDQARGQGPEDEEMEAGMTYRDDDLMRCDCGGNPVVVEILWAGTEREARRCHLCCPKYAKVAVHVLDHKTGTVVIAGYHLAMRWGDLQERYLQAFKKMQEPEPEPEPPKPSLFQRFLGGAR